jgi:class 3 adenylate cyclase
MPTEEKSFRIDFKQEIVSLDRKTGLFEFRLTPDPERYEYHETSSGDKGYFDKFDKTFIPIEEIKKALDKMLSQKGGIPIYYSPSKIENADEYISKRIDSIKEFFDEKEERFEFKDASEEFLESLDKDKMRFVILSIDLKSSTKMSQQISLEVNADIISLFSREMTLIVDKFNGYNLKNVGDGLIAYFPEPNFIGMNDNALDCAVTMKKMIIHGINPILKIKGFPELNFRIGLDSGEAIIKTIGAEKLKIHKDLIGETINIACKIQSLAQDKQILIGESTALNVHTFWRKKIKRLEPPKNWNYKDKDTGELYPIYFLIESW